MSAMVLPELFSRGAQFTRTNTKNLLKKYEHLLRLKEGASILEFGFADGSNSRKNLAPLLPSNYKEFFGVDLSRQMVDYSQKNVVMPKSEFRQLDIAAENVPAEFEQRFDNVISFFTLHMLIAKQAFKNIHRMLKPSGETFHLLYKRLPLEYVFDRLSRHPKWGKCGHELIMTHDLNSNPKMIFQEAIENANFKNVNFEEEEITYTFPNEQAWKDLFFSVNPLVNSIPKEAIDEYKHDFFDAVRKELLHQDENDKNNEDGKVLDKITFTAYIVSAKKA